jgi:ribonuclease M5
VTAITIAMNAMNENTQKLKLDRAVVVEGKYDKIKLSAIVDGVILVTNGFGIYRDKELCKLIRFYAEKSGLVIITDSDRAGRQIRSHIKSIVPKEFHENIANIHIPQIHGKEKRKSQPSKEGTLGVEGISADILRSLLEKYKLSAESVSRADEHERITKNDMYMLGLSGRPDSSLTRRRLAEKMGFPDGLSASALLDLLNTVSTKQEIEDTLAEIRTNATL